MPFFIFGDSSGVAVGLCCGDFCFGNGADLAQNHCCNFRCRARLAWRCASLRLYSGSVGGGERFERGDASRPCVKVQSTNQFLVHEC